VKKNDITEKNKRKTVEKPHETCLSFAHLYLLVPFNDRNFFNRT